MSNIKGVVLSFILYLCCHRISCDESLALRQSQWYFWTRKCGAEFREAMDAYSECAITLKANQTCEKTANDAALCYKPFEDFHCSDEKMMKEVRLMGRREKNIQNTILCKLKPTLKENCIMKLDVNICRPQPDNTLNDICASISEINSCLKKLVREKCEIEEMQIMDEYLDVVSKEVICLGYTPKDSAAKPAIWSVSLILCTVIIFMFTASFES